MQLLTGELSALFQVIMIDLVLAGDNALLVGMAVAGLPPALRRRAILLGVGTATVLRIGLALITLQLLAIIGLTLAGGLLLLFVCWRMYLELRRHQRPTPEATHPPATKTMRAAMFEIALADLSMSLDNVLAVAGAAREHPTVLVIGLSLSVVLMALAANLVARLLARWRWIGWVGLLIVAVVALRMIHEGTAEVAHQTGYQIPGL
jgi:YjbE family integral membrane protein